MISLVWVIIRIRIPINHFPNVTWMRQKGTERMCCGLIRKKTDLWVQLRCYVGQKTNATFQQKNLISPVMQYQYCGFIISIFHVEILQKNVKTSLNRSSTVGVWSETSYLGAKGPQEIEIQIREGERFWYIRGKFVGTCL